MRRSELLRRLPIESTDFVVEIGAGPVPFQHTKLILEKYPFENSERHGDTKNVAPVLKADAMMLPLKDKGCDVLFASHVLEHIESPELFLAEAKRCSRFMYLEFPTPNRELMYAWSFHPWLIEIEGEKLIFFRNDIPQLFGDFFHAYYDFLIDAWSELRFEDLNNHIYVSSDRLSFEFSDLSALEYVLEKSAKGEQKVNYRSDYARDGVGNVRYPRDLIAKIVLWALTPDWLLRRRRAYVDKRNAGRALQLTGEVLERLLCPRCRSGQLAFVEASSSSEIVCQACESRYQQEQGIFDFDV